LPLSKAPPLLSASGRCGRAPSACLGSAQQPGYWSFASWPFESVFPRSAPLLFVRDFPTNFSYAGILNTLEPLSLSCMGTSLPPRMTMVPLWIRILAHSFLLLRRAGCRFKREPLPLFGLRPFVVPLSNSFPWMALPPRPGDNNIFFPRLVRLC